MSDTAALIAALVLLLAWFLGIRGLGYGVDGWRNTRPRRQWTFDDISAHRHAFANIVTVAPIAIAVGVSVNIGTDLVLDDSPDKADVGITLLAITTLVTLSVAGVIALWSLRDPWIVATDSGPLVAELEGYRDNPTLPRRLADAERTLASLEARPAGLADRAWLQDVLTRMRGLDPHSASVRGARKELSLRHVLRWAMGPRRLVFVGIPIALHSLIVAFLVGLPIARLPYIHFVSWQTPVWWVGPGGGIRTVLPLSVSLGARVSHRRARHGRART
jgi:hypothetical protein